VKSSFIDKVRERLGDLSSTQVEVVVDRLAREKGFLEQVLEALQEGVILFDQDGVMLFINTAASSMFGLGESACEGRSLSEVLPGLDWASFLSEEGRVSSRDLEIRYPERRLLNIYTAPIDGEMGLATVARAGRVMLLRDITSQVEETAQSLESERFNALTLLAAGVAHEIGNPLNSLGIQLQLLRRKVIKLDDSGLTKHIDRAQAEVERLDIILKDFLHAVRPSQPNRTPSNLNTILQHTLEGMQEELRARKTQLALHCADAIPLLNLDSGQLRQALYNVIRNASQSTSAVGGMLTITTTVTDYEVRLSVQDNGQGISPEEMGRIYEPFRSSKKEEGTGLGLLIVRRIIREHGGEMQIESELGAGTQVTFSFPREDQRMKLLGSAGQVIVD